MARQRQRCRADLCGDPVKKLISRLGAALVVAVSLAGSNISVAQSNDTIDSRITFVLADDNIFAGSADFSPSADIGQRSRIKTFFDNYDTKDSGQETKTNFVFYRQIPSANKRIWTEAGLVARLDFFTDEETGKPGTRLNDDGTFLQASYLLGALAEDRKPGDGSRIYFLAFPFNADRMRLGYSFDITWGGNRTFPKNTAGAPGFKLGWEGEVGGRRIYAFQGLKTHRQLNEVTNDLDTVYGVLGGFGIDLTSQGPAHRDQRGLAPVPQRPDVPMAGLQAYGVQRRVVVHDRVGGQCPDPESSGSRRLRSDRASDRYRR
jgi:hypothetical protein